ncbi:MAG TPA: CRTAC1 family protein [Candidatus Acidoferrales bacterium]|nr:CRTAC1 family protein [Candidatus Acidoferrales bacterium]
MRKKTSATIEDLRRILAQLRSKPGAAGRAPLEGTASLDRRSMMLSMLGLAAAPILGRAAPRYLQHQQPKSAKPSGVMTGGEYAPIYDAHHRPITAGGFVDGAPVIYDDYTHHSGLKAFEHRSGTHEKATILEVDGSGVGLIDYDNDGWLDIYLVNGSTFAALKGTERPPRAMLFHNNRNGTFTDVTEKAGVANERWGFGVAIADFDNDGWPDIYVSNFGKNRLYRNNHDGTFTDIAEKAGVAAGGWSTGATWGDYDRDGRLDLFVPGYIKFDPDHPTFAGKNGVSPSSCEFRGISVFCGPLGLQGEQDHLFHNNGDGTFTEVSVKAGVSDPNGAYGWSSVFVDVDDDGWLDLLVANDSVANYLYKNNHDGTFKDDSYMSGIALNADGRAQASMGIGVGDYNRDGRVDFHVTTFSDDYKPLYRNDGEGEFTDVTAEAGLLQPTIPFLGWGTGFLDFDNDGLLDIFSANGHVYVQADGANWGTTWAQRPLLFRNLNGRRFQEVPAATGSGLAVVIPARGAAFGDLFNRGQIDVVINNIDSHPTLLRNAVKSTNHWITFKLVGGPKSPRDAIGAKVFVTASGVRQRVDIISGASYCSTSDPRAHFGLGASKKIDGLEIHWPSGVVEDVPPPDVDRIVTITEGQGKPRSS